ncbi:MAG: hypothetical protein IKC24_05330 [Oscillospiraceae bacterium]|nr:hypothetical protein [Oscillospiraceae bacterium]
MAGKSKEYIFFVKHPQHTIAPVIAENWEQATVKAADFWGVKWGKVAALCECERKMGTHKGVCMDCNKVFYGGEVICPMCLRARKDEERRKQEWLKSGGASLLPKRGLQVKMI